MIYSIHRAILGFVAPDHLISCRRKLWLQVISELRQRGDGTRESGAFLLGTRDGERRRVADVAYFDDLDPECLVGTIDFSGTAFPALWDICKKKKLVVVADVHTHPGGGVQSETDKCNPMIRQRGHLGLIIPDYAVGNFDAGRLGIYEYMGDHRWTNHSSSLGARAFYTGMWS